MIELKYPLFDGKTFWDGASVSIENGVITAVEKCNPAKCSEGFLMPGLIDAHTHMGTTAQVDAMLRSGITATCDVSASKELMDSSRKLEIISSLGMAMGVVLNPKGFVDRAAANGARYIKVLLFNTLSVGKLTLRSIVKAAHEKELKVAVHATEVATVRQAVDVGADILLHVPMKAPFPIELAKNIAEKKIVVVPTLVMMETFSKRGQFGYKESDYSNAEAAVKLLHDCDVPILVATDANPGSFAPAVAHGTAIHREMELLVKAGLTQLEVLQGATIKVAEAFGMEKAGLIAPGQPATMVLVEGRPDREITDTAKIWKIWVKGEQVV